MAAKGKNCIFSVGPIYFKITHFIILQVNLHTVLITSAMTGGDRQGTFLSRMECAFRIRPQVRGQKNSTATIAVTVQEKSFECFRCVELRFSQSLFY